MQMSRMMRDIQRVAATTRRMGRAWHPRRVVSVWTVTQLDAITTTCGPRAKVLVRVRVAEITLPSGRSLRWKPGADQVALIGSPTNFVIQPSVIVGGAEFTEFNQFNHCEPISGGTYGVEPARNQTHAIEDAS